MLLSQQPLGERVVIGCITGLIISVAIGISSGIKNAKQKNRKDFDEVSKNETNADRVSDWDEIKKDE